MMKPNHTIQTLCLLRLMVDWKGIKGARKRGNYESVKILEELSTKLTKLINTYSWRY